MSQRFLAHLLVPLSIALALSCSAQNNSSESQYAPGTGPTDRLQLPAPFATPSARNQSKVIGWPPGKTPKAEPGFEVSLFADNLANPRQTYVCRTRMSSS